MSGCRHFPLCDMACDGCCEPAQCVYFESMPDVAALLSLADEIDAKSNDGTVNPDPMKPIASSLDLFGYARRIREACGVEA